MMWLLLWRCLFLLFLLQEGGILAEITSGRIKGEDEPHLVSWRVLEGITEPFETSQQTHLPPWKLMKNAADQKAASMAIQQALHEYGQLLRHPYMFGEMPAEERYDVFLSMAKLLKTMGFHQRAELLLYEAMSHTTNAFEAHYQLGLLFLEKEDLDQAKMHLKNCLFFKEADTVILAHLAVILLIEGRIHETKFFLSRIIATLESRVQKLSFLMSDKEMAAMLGPVPHSALLTWTEELVVKVLYGEFRITPTSTIEVTRYFSNLYRWVTSGDLTGRFLFDLGQSLYEGGRPYVGKLLMRRGFETTDKKSEGDVSVEVVQLRLTFDFPLVPHSLSEVAEAYLNITSYLSESAHRYYVMDIENSLDIYWPLPLLAWSALPVAPVLGELLWRFDTRSWQSNGSAAAWRQVTSHEDVLLESSRKTIPQQPRGGQSQSHLDSSHLPADLVEDAIGHFQDLVDRFQDDPFVHIVVSPEQTKKKQKVKGLLQEEEEVEKTEKDTEEEEVKTVTVGILGGHMNNHPVGQTVLHNLLAYLQHDESPLGSVTYSCETPPPPPSTTTTTTNRRKKRKKKLHLVLLSLPLVSDRTTKRIAQKVDEVINLPGDPRQASRILNSLDLDVILFPDWQPFPDQQAFMLQALRHAPVQICFYVRGSSCVSENVDYYLLPREMESYYLQAVPAAASHSKRQIKTSKTNNTLYRPLRPAWREPFAEQVVLLDWPLLTSQRLRGTLQGIQSDNDANANRKGGSSDHSSSSSLDNTLAFISLESEGKIFFDGQPVAVLPFDPSFLHPLMDETIFKLMRAIPSLQIVLALPQSFQGHAQDVKHQISWARRLARRLWIKGGTLYHRIRSLPYPLSDQRMVQLLRQADLVLDTFPIGASQHILALAISVGTPVVTMRPGTRFSSSKEDLQEVRYFLSHPQSVMRFKDHPLRALIGQADLPWLPATSAVAAFFQQIGLSDQLVANSTLSYFQLAEKILLNRELGYELRVKILEDIDAQHCVEERLSCCPGRDLETFLYQVGFPWAASRSKKSPLSSKRQETKKLSRADLDESFQSYLRVEGTGAIV